LFRRWYSVLYWEYGIVLEVVWCSSGSGMAFSGCVIVCIVSQYSVYGTVKHILNVAVINLKNSSFNSISMLGTSRLWSSQAKKSEVKVG
jgi:hypothetical protein